MQSNVSNRMIFINSNVSKLFKKQHTSTLYCLSSKRNLDESSNSIFIEFKESRSYKIYWDIASLSQYKGTMNRVDQYKSRVLFQELQVSS